VIRIAVEWRTIALAAIIYGGWIAATLWHAVLPTWLLVPIGAWIIAWHGSLQHETIHGHPTRSAGFNAVLGGVPLSLWLPYRIYRRTHLAHHATPNVTDPLHDPESRYLASSSGHIGALRHRGERVQATLAGRLLLGPPILVVTFLLAEARRVVREPGAAAADWIPHLLASAAILSWLNWVGLDWARYLLVFVYPGTALTLLRSFAEHRAAPEPGERIAIVERPGALGLLFLNNNLHAAHHRVPALAWYALPAYHARHRAALLAANGGLLYRGYGEIVRRYLFRPHDDVLHPDHGRRAAA
jgi:fatty acid desaturase